MVVLSKKITELEESATLAMARKARELREKGREIISLSLGEPDFNTPEFIKTAAKEAIDQNFSKYTPVPGYKDLLHTISNKFQRDNQLIYNENQIVCSTGAKQSIAQLLMVLLNKNDEVILPAPYWVSYYQMIKLAEGKPHVIQTSIDTDFKISPQQLEENISTKTKAFLFSSPCNPTGSVYSKQELYDLANVFQKHPEFCFVRGDPMSGDEIRTIRRNLRNSTGQKLEYTHPLFQLLKRGIGVYLHSFPDEYNRVVQTLLSQKKLGVVLSDKTLCLGIDLPIRTVAFSGYKQPDYTTSDYLQMSGRAGRRGHDNQGNIVFHHVSNYKRLMRGELPQLKGSSQPIHTGYNALRQLLPDANLQHIHTSRINQNTNPLNNQIVDYTDNRYTRLEWLCRNYEKGHIFVSQLHKLEKHVFRQSEHEREEWLLSYLISQLGHSDKLLGVLKTNRIDRDQTKTLQELYTLGECMRQMIRNLNQIQSKLTITHLQNLFQKIRTVVTKYRFE